VLGLDKETVFLYKIKKSLTAKALWTYVRGVFFCFFVELSGSVVSCSNKKYGQSAMQRRC